MVDYVKDHPFLTVLWGILGVFVLMAIYDVFQRKHAIRHNFPLVGRLRYFFEMIGPELRQYWVANDKEELPFNRHERSWLYASAKGQNNTFGFGTSEQIYGVGYPIIKNAAFPFPELSATHVSEDKTAVPCTKIMGERHGRKRPYRPTSIINISAMSFGSLGYRAVTALNQGAAKAHCFHNTGEGGISPYHRKGADLVWQLGTGYFGARGPDGRFSLEKCVERVKEVPQVRAIEIKLSQGAKPGKGGILPGAKVTPEIAEIRGIPVGEDCMSPNSHAEFSSLSEMIDFIERLAEATGLPVGIKAAIGGLTFWEQLADHMKANKTGPDFITIDGGEGGTGAAPLTFADHVSLPFKIAFQRVYKIFLDRDIAHEIVWIGSAKLGFPDRAVVALAMGCDLINIAREAMMAVGCIQAQKCHTGHCPAGVATQQMWFQKGLDIEDKTERFARYVKTFRKELLALSYAAGYEHPAQFTGDDIEFSTGVNKFSTLTEVLGYSAKKPEFTHMKDYTAV
ncbi:MAG: FMN-binding glutamate synthase family protein [Planctomycetota bacterium]